MPTLLTRMSQAGSALTSASQPAAVEVGGDPAQFGRRDGCPRGGEGAIDGILPAPVYDDRGAAASPQTMAKPMPEVEPVTIAVLAERSIFRRNPFDKASPRTEPQPRARHAYRHAGFVGLTNFSSTGAVPIIPITTGSSAPCLTPS